MRKPWCAALVAVSITLIGPAIADEGMWTFDRFPTAQMRAAHGWAPDAAWLKHAQLASLRLAQGCSASLVSAQGLVLTNHHCARECLAELGDAKHDFIANGFYARALADEKKCPALEANQLVDISDVTRPMEAATAGKSDRAFHDAERAAKARIESACGTASDVRCEVVTLYHGGVYELYKYKRYQDIRVVFAPEESAAMFGGDPDNFTFPRYDLDATFVRIYDNGKPLQADAYLNFATTGVKQGDIAMVSGNPGGTEREVTLAQLQAQRDVIQPFNLYWRSELRGVLNEFMTKGPAEVQMAGPLRDSIENSLKLFKGRQLALTSGSLVADKARAESDLQKRVAANPKVAFGADNPWDAIARASAHQQNIYERYALLVTMPRLSDLLRYATALNRYAAESVKPNDQRLEEYADANFPAMKQQIISPAPVHAELEKTILAWWLEKVREYLGTGDADVKALLGKQSPQEIAAAMVNNSKLADANYRAQLLAGGAAAINAYHDPLMDFARRLDAPARAVRADYENAVRAVITKNSAMIAKARFALDGQNSYPDATFTPRLSYGIVSGFEENGRQIPATTTFGGAFDHATGREPFKLPNSWTRAEKSIDPKTNLNFASTNDVIGGNSGSPVIGRDGKITGLVFDGNIQSLGGDFGYDGKVNRTVSVDVTGITEALKNIYHADRLIKELAQ
jgi:hypothetical protein